MLADPNRPDFTADEDDTWEPALQVLGFWTDHYRRAWQQNWDHTPTLITEAKFLRHNLGRIAAAEPNWVHFAHDVKRARLHLENILHAGRRPDRTRVICNNPTCERKPNLIRVYAPRTVTGWTCRGCGISVPADTDLDHCPNPWCWTTAPPAEVWVSDETADQWKCPSCKTRYDDDGHQRAHEQQLRHESAAMYVPLRDAIGTLRAQGRSERTIRKWLEPPLKVEDQCIRCRRRWPHQEHAACPRKLKRRGEYIGEQCGGELVETYTGDPEAVVEAYCNARTHQVWVYWPDLWRLHLSTQTRHRKPCLASQ